MAKYHVRCISSNFHLNVHKFYLQTFKQLSLNILHRVLSYLLLNFIYGCAEIRSGGTCCVCLDVFLNLPKHVGAANLIWQYTRN